MGNNNSSEHESDQRSTQREDRNQQTSQQSGGWFDNLVYYVQTYGPLVQLFLEQLSQSMEESRRQAQQEAQAPPNLQFYMMSGMPRITGNPMLDQMIVMSHGELFRSNMNVNDNGIRFTFNVPGDQQQMPTMEEILQTTFNQAQRNQTTTDPQAISNLPTIRLTKERMEFKQLLQKSLDESCPICIEDYKTDEMLVQLPCGHAFHKDCILPWITEKNSCPTCRFELPLADAEQERDRVKRMKERFTKQGLQIMKIAKEDETVFDKLYEIRKDMEKSRRYDENTANRLTTSLTSLGSFLETRLSTLDEMNQLENDNMKHMKKNEIQKVQFLLDRIETMRNDVQSSVSTA
jgi:hypothetical protein